MKAKTLGIIEEALVQGLREAGVSLSREERAFARKLISDKTFRRLAEAPDSAKGMFLNVMVAEFLVSLKKGPEPSPEKLDELLQKIPAIAYEVRSGLLQGVQQIAKQLPRKRGGGPKPRLATPAEKNQACAQIAALIGQGVKSRGHCAGRALGPGRGGGQLPDHAKNMERSAILNRCGAKIPYIKGCFLQMQVAKDEIK